MFFHQIVRPCAMVMNGDVERMIQHLLLSNGVLKLGENDEEERGVE